MMGPIDEQDGGKPASRGLPDGDGAPLDGGRGAPRTGAGEAVWQDGVADAITSPSGGRTACHGALAVRRGVLSAARPALLRRASGWLGWVRVNVLRGGCRHTCDTPESLALAG